jgi:hypothetical protein
MRAIVPLNVAAVRVNANDASDVVSQFKGRTAVFDQLPWDANATQASTGDMIVQPLQSTDSPANSLGVGVHVHWELPDYFRKGVQPPTGGKIVFPQVPNRWLVIRYLRVWNSVSNAYDPVTPKTFIVESDYVGATLWTDSWGVVRPTVSTPLTDAATGQPFMYMGRVLDYADWAPSTETASQFLPSYTGTDGQPLYLTAVGFVGPGFCNYYPECCSVFGFWDHFKDNAAVYSAITNNTAIKFEASYQVIGWIDPSASDPLADIATTVTTQYNDYVANCNQRGVPVADTPASIFESIAGQQFQWNFNTADIAYTLNSDDTLDTLSVPTATLCAGVVQEVVWDMLENAATTYFLTSSADPSGPGGPTAVWTDTVNLAVGNTTAEALSAILKQDLDSTVTAPDILTNYEYLLDALQLGLLRDLENQPTKTIYLDKSLHAKAFSALGGGWLWTIAQPASASGVAPNPNADITLPLDLAEQLALLNDAQKAYDQGRFALDQLRKQLFMDWFRFVKLYVSGATDPNVATSQLESFLSDSPDGEIAAVVAAGAAAGVLLYQADPSSGQIVGLQPPPTDPGSLATAVWTQYQAVLQALPSGWTLQAAPAPSFYLPTDPVLVVEGARLAPARRNGSGPTIAVRLSSELLSVLSVQFGGADFPASSTSLTGPPTITSTTPHQADLQTLIGEAYLLTPMLAQAVTTVLQALSGNNPVGADPANFIAALNAAQGGLSPLEGRPGGGLFGTVHVAGYTPAANPVQTVTSPLAIGVTFTNAASNGRAPDPVAWSAQQAQPTFSSTRVDPFLPLYLIWGATIDPLKYGNGQSYTSDNLTQYFSLDPDAVDYLYATPAAFTTGVPVAYGGSIVLSTKPTNSLAGQVQAYLRNNPSDPIDTTLTSIQQDYAGRALMSVTMSGLNVQQALRAFVPQIQVQDLPMIGEDPITTSIQAAASATPNDNWYDFAFNSVSPIATGPLAQNNFGPLRSGFLAVTDLEVVDVFGQRMQLSTASTNPDGSLQAVAAMTMQPASSDTVNQDKVYLPPRLLAPTRLWFRWLSAMHDTAVSGIASDFVEMNTHPATSPVCGWVLPNHLDDSLFFYDAGGQPIGSFGLEAGASVYRTQAGNLANPGDSLSADIGLQGSPTVNAHLADFMWFVSLQDAGFLTDLLTTIQASDMFINPADFAQNAALAVLVGRPLALTRTVLSMETRGGLLPLSQADTVSTDAFPQDVNNLRYAYAARQPYSSANLGGVQFPIRMGDLADIDDGLVGYLIEGSGSTPYTTFYSAAAPVHGVNGVVPPTATTLQVTLNAPPTALTMLVDPRAAVHASTGVLPDADLRIPPSQYLRGLRNLAMTFFTTPVLSKSQGLVVPAPQESGYAWNWITPGAASATPIAANAANGDAVYGYTPQQLLEGWLQLQPRS